MAGRPRTPFVSQPTGRKRRCDTRSILRRKLFSRTDLRPVRENNFPSRQEHPLRARRGTHVASDTDALVVEAAMGTDVRHDLRTLPPGSAGARARACHGTKQRMGKPRWQKTRACSSRCAQGSCARYLADLRIFENTLRNLTYILSRGPDSSKPVRLRLREPRPRSSRAPFPAFSCSHWKGLGVAHFIRCISQVSLAKLRARRHDAPALPAAPAPARNCTRVRERTHDRPRLARGRAPRRCTRTRVLEDNAC